MLHINTRIRAFINYCIHKLKYKNYILLMDIMHMIVEI